MRNQQSKKIGFGGGCHWCTEAVFQTLRGVARVAQGFIRSEPPHDSWSEAVLIEFDPEEIDLSILIEIHLRTHSSTSQHKMRGKYRSAVYCFTPKQLMEVNRTLMALQPHFENNIITQAMLHEAFKPSDIRFQNYYETNPDRPFCQTYIDPKLKLLRERFAGHTRDQSNIPQS